MKVTGATPEERQVARKLRAADNRARLYLGRMQSTTNPRERLQLACEYLRAVADDATDEQVAEMAAEVTATADRRNPK